MVNYNTKKSPRFGIESMHGTRDAENNHRYSGIEGLGLGRADRVRNPIGEPRNSSEHGGTLRCYVKQRTCGGRPLTTLLLAEKRMSNRRKGKLKITRKRKISEGKNVTTTPKSIASFEKGKLGLFSIIQIRLFRSFLSAFYSKIYGISTWN